MDVQTLSRNMDAFVADLIISLSRRRDVRDPSAERRNFGKTPPHRRTIII